MSQDTLPTTIAPTEQIADAPAAEVPFDWSTTFPNRVRGKRRHP